MLGLTLKGAISLVSLACLLANASAAATTKKTGTIKDVEHVVLFMQENRAFDHYFGSMAGVRGFGDPNVHIASTGRPVWFQEVGPSISNATTALLPYYVNGGGGNSSERTQCMIGGSNGFEANHDALNGGENNQWVNKNTPWSWSYLLRKELPVQFTVAEAWTMADMYAQSVIASTVPNRSFWASGSVNVPGGPQNDTQGGTTIDNNGTPGCEAPHISCYPLGWKTNAEYYEEAGTTWQVFQDDDNFGDNPFAWFQQFQNAPEDSSLAQRGLSFLGLERFYQDAAQGTLPEVSYIIGPAEVSEHPPWSALDGGSFQQLIIEAVMNSPKYDSTVLIISYDETGGFGDHVLPITAPENTPGEWMVNPFDPNNGTVPAGTGYRLPFYVISPWTRGGYLYTEACDHSSQIKFVEKWQASKGRNVTTDQLNGWRRENKCDLLKMFDFEHPDYSLPTLPPRRHLGRGPDGSYLGSTACQEEFPNAQPDVPYGKQTREDSLIIETGFKQIRGSPTEGRFLVFEAAGLALSLDTSNKAMTVGNAVKNHDTPLNRIILHATAPPPATTFNLQFFEPISGKVNYVTSNLKATPNIKNAATFQIEDLGSGQGYTIEELSSKKFVSITGASKKDLTLGKTATQFTVFSVTKASDSGTGFL